MRKNRLPVLLAFAALCSCGDSEKATAPGVDLPPGSTVARDYGPALPAGHIEVDHILIAFRGAERSTAMRTREEARALAHDLFDKLKAGGDWDVAKRQYSGDPPPGGPYRLADRRVPPAAPMPVEFPRDQMAPAFGDVGFALKVGEMGLAEFDPAKSPFGWHIIKRVR